MAAGKRARPTVLVFGNPLVPGDATAPALVPALQKAFPGVRFKRVDPSEDLEREGKTLFIIDAVEGLERCAVITRFEQLARTRAVSLHGFDLGASLLLLKKAGYLERFTVFGVPLHYTPAQALRELVPLLKRHLG